MFTEVRNGDAMAGWVLGFRRISGICHDGSKYPPSPTNDGRPTVLHDHL